MTIQVTVDGHCSASGCEAEKHARGMCRSHYLHWWRNRDTLPTPPTITSEQRFMALVEKTDGCWMWRGASTSRGYGIVVVNRRRVAAHRQSYEMFVSTIDSGMVIDHTCHNEAVAAGICAGGAECAHRKCVNPDHLRMVTQQENIASGALGYANRTHCRSGRHDIRGASAVVVGPHGKQCKKCMQESAIRYREEMKTERSR